MGLIKQLTENVSNQISAGEVVERPSSIVKELIENSIDAGSTQILIEIDNGGRDRIRVKDNGSGIAEDDIELAFARYATSKIENVNDLYSIKTLGFRGEALASIASVSKIKINSRTTDSVKGTYMQLNGGKVIKKEPIGTQVGTDIIIEDIFFNTPARFKYLKTINTEFSHISSIVSREAMAYPDIQFVLIHNDKQVLKTPGTGNLLDIIYSIYGQEMVDNLIPIEYEENYVKLSGYIAKPEFTRSSRIYQLFFVNNRPINNRCLNRGVEKGYHGLLPSSRHPVAIVKVKLNQILVDVNVHPTKREVQFSRDEIIENVVKKGIKVSLSELNLAPKFKRDKLKDINKKKERRLQSLDFDDGSDRIVKSIEKNNSESDELNIKQKSIYSNDIDNKDLDHKDINHKDINHKNIDSNSSSDTNYKKSNNSLSSKSNLNNNKDLKKQNNLHLSKENTIFKNKEKRYIKSYTDNNNIVKENNNNNNNKNLNKKMSNNNFPDSIKKIFGQINNTYILVEGMEGLYIIDQHNAHERVLYENYYYKYNNQEIITQSLLVPVTIEVSLAEKELIDKYTDQLTNVGIKIEPFGGSSFIITEIPNFIKNVPAKNIIRDIIDNLSENGKTMQQAEMIDTIITYMSCRGAIKAGKHLDQMEMEKLVIDLFSRENIYRCPHGRPIIVHMSNNEIDKSMGR